MTDLVIWKRFVEIESAKYIGKYVRQHTGAPKDVQNPTNMLRASLRDEEAATIRWCENEWEIEPFTGWENE